jgi:hypothetical protein
VHRCRMPWWISNMLIFYKAMSYVLGHYFDLASVDDTFLIVAKLLFCVMDLDDEIRNFGYFIM